MPFILYVLIALAAAGLTALILFLRAARIKRVRTEPVYPRAADPELCQRAAESLSELIRFRTVSYGMQGDCAEWVRLRDCLKRQYPLVHKKMEREVVGLYSLLYRWPAPAPEGDPLLLCGHLDVVPADEEADRAPFEGTIADEYVWGRGALDGKQVVVCLLESAESLLASGFIPKRDIYFAFTHDEETGEQEGAAFIARLFARRKLRFKMILDEGGALKRGVLSLRRPVAEVGVAEKGAVQVRLTAQSESGHTSEPPRRTALGAISEAISRVEYKPRPRRLTPLVYDSLKMLAPFLSFSWRLHVANRWGLTKRLAVREPAWARTTIAPTMLHAGKAVNVLPSKAEAMLDIRLLPGETSEDILRYLRDLFAGLGISVMALSAWETGAVSDYAGEIFQMLSELIQKVFGPVPVIPALSARTSGARHYEIFSDCVYRFMPFILSQADLASIHGNGERVAVDSLGLAMAFYGRVITKMAG